MKVEIAFVENDVVTIGTKADTYIPVVVVVVVVINVIVEDFVISGGRSVMMIKTTIEAVVRR